MIHLGFLASHGGSNVQAIIDAIKKGSLDAEACAVISNNSGAKVLERARSEGVPHYPISAKTAGGPEAADEEIIRIFKKHGVDTIVLAGYMKMLGTPVIKAFSGRVLNIHPALLPKYGGKGMYGRYVHEAVIAAGEKESGPTIHTVDEKYDKGRILAQNRVPVFPDDTPDTLADRVLKEEHKIYADTLQKISSGEIVL